MTKTNLVDYSLGETCPGKLGIGPRSPRGRFLGRFPVADGSTPSMSEMAMLRQLLANFSSADRESRVYDSKEPHVLRQGCHPLNSIVIGDCSFISGTCSDFQRAAQLHRG